VSRSYVKPVKNVVDASIGFKWELTEHLLDKALQLRDDLRNGIRELIAPDFFPIELGNAFLIAERRGRTTNAFDLYTDLMLCFPTLHSSIALFPRAFEIASQTRTTVYDCLYVALTEREQCDLITADERLMRALPNFPIISLAVFA
jgi:predicted nucleic acid-binding protein